MNPFSSKEELQSLIETAGFSLSALTPREGFRLMFTFYDQIIADGCTAPPERDMLLYQWGIYDWGHGRFFELDLTRQFIVAADDPDDESINQLRLTFYYRPSHPLEQLQSGNRWCESRPALPDFNSFVMSSPAFLAASASQAHNIAIEYGGT
ncbi:MAG: hypothetical protein WDO13_00245 [Verrucomicrobiota bacterium]